MKGFVKKVINKAFKIRLNDRVNVLKTLLINFVCFPFRTAMKLPIVIYGPCKIGDLSGSVLINSVPKYGMLKIGLSDPNRSVFSKSYISIEGLFSFGESCVLRRGIHFHVSRKGNVKLERDVFIGDNCSIISGDAIIIGKATRIANDVSIMDTDFHFIINTKNRQVKPNSSPVIIGDNNWIGTRTIIKKGTKTPNGTIVSGPNSMLSKDYSKIIPNNSIIAGCPAKLLLENFRRVNNDESDTIISDYFLNNTGVFVLSDDVDIDKFCSPK